MLSDVVLLIATQFRVIEAVETVAVRRTAARSELVWEKADHVSSAARRTIVERSMDYGIKSWNKGPEQGPFVEFASGITWKQREKAGPLPPWEVHPPNVFGTNSEAAGARCIPWRQS